MLATNDTPLRKLTGVLKVKKPGLPLFAVPTTAGTGSEVTIAAVVSDPDTHQKTPVMDPKVVPVAAALDPLLMVGMPPHITAATGMDALTQRPDSSLQMCRGMAYLEIKKVLIVTDSILMKLGILDKLIKVIDETHLETTATVCCRGRAQDLQCHRQGDVSVAVGTQYPNPPA